MKALTLIVFLVCFTVMMGLKPKSEAHFAVNGKIAAIQQHQLKRNEQHNMGQQLNHDGQKLVNHQYQQSTTSNYHEHNCEQCAEGKNKQATGKSMATSDMSMASTKNEQRTSHQLKSSSSQQKLSHNLVRSGQNHEMEPQSSSSEYVHDKQLRKVGHDYYEETTTPDSYDSNENMNRGNMFRARHYSTDVVHDQYSAMDGQGINGNDNGNNDDYDDYEDDDEYQDEYDNPNLNQGQNFMSGSQIAHRQNDLEQPNYGERYFYVDDNDVRRVMRQEDTSSVSLRDHVDYNKELGPDETGYGGTSASIKTVGSTEDDSYSEETTPDDKALSEQAVTTTPYSSGASANLMNPNTGYSETYYEQETTPSQSIELHDPNDDRSLISHRSKQSLLDSTQTAQADHQMLLTKQQANKMPQPNQQSMGGNDQKRTMDSPDSVDENDNYHDKGIESHLETGPVNENEADHKHKWRNAAQ